MHSKGVGKMKKIKDFFYDKNDIIIELLIVAAAAFLIYNRINAIMDYPAKYAEEMEKATTQQVVETTEAPEATEPSQAEEPSEAGDASTDSSDEEN